MSLHAAGAYLRALREARGLSQTQIARYVHVSSYRQVQRWEAGQAEMGLLKGAAFAAVVGADPAQLHRLLLDPEATATTGQELARLRLALERYDL